MTITSINNMGPGPVLERFILTYKDLTAAAGTQTITLKALPRGSFVMGVRVKHQVAFAGGSISACTVAVGSTGGATNTFLSAVDIFAAVADGTFYVSSTKGLNAGTYAADNITATIATTGGNVSTATAGQVSIDVLYFMLEDLTGTGVPSGGGGYLS